MHQYTSKIAVAAYKQKFVWNWKCKNRIEPWLKNPTTKDKKNDRRRRNDCCWQLKIMKIFDEIANALQTAAARVKEKSARLTK